jgi:hypothetical protein
MQAMARAVDERGRAAGRRGSHKRRLTVALVLLGMAAAGPAAAAKPHTPAVSHASGNTLRASDEAKLHYVEAEGEEVYETGSASGTLPGGIRVHMIFSSTFSGRFTIYTHGGSIDGRGRAKPHGSGVWESFAGTLVVTGGSGRYRHAHGTAHIYGTFNRESYALKIKTAGTLRF